MIIKTLLFPFKILLFLVRPRYFRKITNVGKILKTNDNVLDSNKFNKPGRRVVVTSDDGKYIKVNKITSDKDFDHNASKKQRDKQKRHTIKIDYKKYPKALNKPSVVDKKQYERNAITGRKFKISDNHFKNTNERLNKKDETRVLKNKKPQLTNVRRGGRSQGYETLKS